MAHKKDIKDPNEELSSFLFVIGRIVREKMHTNKSGKKDSSKNTPHGSFLQLKTLALIKEKKDPVMKEVADYLRITSPSATIIINSLVRSGEIERFHDPQDKRKIRLKITEKGLRSFQTGCRYIAEITKNLTEILNEKEKIELSKLLRKINNYHTN